MLETKHRLYVVPKVQFEDNSLVFAVKVLSLLERISSTSFDSLSAFSFGRSVVPNLTSGVMGLNSHTNCAWL